MPILERDGVEIFYEAHGPEGAPAILLTHGYSATSRMWGPQVDALSARHRLIVWDLRGHGASASPADVAAYAESEAVADVAALLDANGVDCAVIGGLSLGGYVSLAFRLEHPERVSALMLFDTGPGYKKDAPREAWNEMARERADVLEARGLAALGQGAEVRASTHRSAEGLARAARGLLAQRDARVIESLPAIDVPTLVLVGERDRPFLAATEYMAAKIPGAKKVVVEGAGHAANIDAPEAFNRAVLDFLDGLR